MDQGEIGTRVQLFTMAMAIWNSEEHATVHSGAAKNRLQEPVTSLAGPEDETKTANVNNAGVNTAFNPFCQSGICPLSCRQVFGFYFSFWDVLGFVAVGRGLLGCIICLWTRLPRRRVTRKSAELY